MNEEDPTIKEETSEYNPYSSSLEKNVSDESQSGDEPEGLESEINENHNIDTDNTEQTTVEPAYSDNYSNYDNVDKQNTWTGTSSGNQTKTHDRIPSSREPAGRKKSRKWQYAAIIAALLLVIGGTVVVIYQSLNGEIYPSNDKIAVIYIQGTLVSSSVSTGLGYASSEDIAYNIRKALKDEDVKAIVLRVNSGGGSATAGEELYSEVKKASESGVPVVVSMGDTAASAAYYLSAPADLIVANPSTMTGSIGTIWQFQNLSAYYEDEGVDYYIVKSGKFKDMGGSWRGLTNEEKTYANSVVTEVFTGFVNDVAEGRDMSVNEVTALADGRIYTGKKAKELGLVDELGSFYDAIDMAAEMGGIDGEPDIVYMNKPSLSSLLFGAQAQANVSTEEVLPYYEQNPYGQLLM